MRLTKSLIIAVMARKLVRQPRPAVAAKTRSLLEREVIARGAFTSVQDLSRKLMRYIRAYSKAAPSNGDIPMFERKSSDANEFTAAEPLAFDHNPSDLIGKPAHALAIPKNSLDAAIASSVLRHQCKGSKGSLL